MPRRTKISMGISEPLAIIILLGVFIALAISFTTYMNTDYSTRRDRQVLASLVEKESINTVIRLIGSRGNAYAFLFKRLDNSNRLYFFLYNGTGYTECRKLVKDTVGGRIYEVGRYSTNDILALQGDTPYSFRYYAKAHGYPETGNINICALEMTDRNTIVTLSLSQNIKPNFTGAQLTEIQAYGRRWRLSGSIEFVVKNLGNPRRPDHLKFNGTGYQLRVGDVVRIEINTTTGKIDITPPGGWILISNNVFATEVRVNDIILARNVVVEITPEVGVEIDTNSFVSSLYIEIYPSPPGFTRVRYGGRTVVDQWNNGDYIRIMEWKINSSTQMVLQLDSTNLYARGIATALYIGSMPKAIAVDRLSVFIVTFINNIPYLVGVYDYKLG